jgi:hypothetical protein
MSDRLIRSYVYRRERPFTPPGEFIMSRVIVGSVLLATVVATLSIAAAATREPASEAATATATTGACVGLPGHDALRSALPQRWLQDL